MDMHFKWYPSRVKRIANGRALVKLAEWPERYMEWIPFTSGRLAQLGLITSVNGKVLQPCAEPSMRQGTTAEISAQTAIEVQQRQSEAWIPAIVVGVSDDGESIMAQFVESGGCTP